MREGAPGGCPKEQKQASCRVGGKERAQRVNGGDEFSTGALRGKLFSLRWLGFET